MVEIVVVVKDTKDNNNSCEEMENVEFLLFGIRDTEDNNWYRYIMYTDNIIIEVYGGSTGLGKIFSTRTNYSVQLYHCILLYSIVRKQIG